MSKRKTILASFKKDNSGIDFYEVHSIYDKGDTYVIRKQGSSYYYAFIKSMYLLVDLKTIFAPKDKMVLLELLHEKNTIDANCLMFYADSNFVKLDGIWAKRDLIALKNRCIKIKFAKEQAIATLEQIKEKSYWLYLKNWFVYIWQVKRQDAKLRRNLKEFKILW